MVSVAAFRVWRRGPFIILLVAEGVHRVEELLHLKKLLTGASFRLLEEGLNRSGCALLHGKKLLRLLLVSVSLLLKKAGHGTFNLSLRIPKHLELNVGGQSAKAALHLFKLVNAYSLNNLRRCKRSRGQPLRG
jgi:hypothetical protein